MAEPRVPAPRRRTLLSYAGAACAAALTGCTTYNANSGGINGGQAAQSSSAPAAAAGGSSAAAGGSAGAAGGSSGAAASGAAVVLARTAEIPVGGGKILADKKIVITEPQSGTFKAFTAVCTHQGCIVNSVSGGTINCPCHGSKFSIANGSVVNGPAPSPLAPVNIEVQGTSIVQA
jgi:Rieske Fe-S protein